MFGDRVISVGKIVDDNHRILIADCPPSAQFVQTVLYKSADFLVERLEATVEKPFTTYSEIPEGFACLLFKEQGNVLIRGEVSSRWYLVPQSGVAIRRGPKRTLIRNGRGKQVVYAITWPVDSLKALIPSIEFAFEGHLQEFGMNGTQYLSFGSHFQSVFTRFKRAILPSFVNEAPALLISVIAEAVAFLGESKGGSFLAPTPHDLPQPIEALIIAVRQNPEHLWPLKLASEQTGYSPFHFSRTFKLLTGYGFHEFVDRTRTEFAVELLCSTTEAIDSVSVSAGFGTTQGMRESMREYLGLVPSEVRSEPKESLIS